VKKPYTGVLTEPIQLKRDSVMSGAIRMTKEYFQRLEALLNHYDVPREHPEKWFLLADALAREHVPGFRVAKPPGRRPAVQTAVDDMMILAELGDAELNGKSVANAANRLVKRHVRFRGRDPEGLRQRYYRLKRDDSPGGVAPENFGRGWQPKKSCHTNSQPLFTNRSPDI
jgi:hypothetical protein